MIYPTARSVALAAIGAPIALVIAAIAPSYWIFGLCWPLAILLLAILDGARSIGGASVTVQLPLSAGVGSEADATIAVTISGGAAPSWVDAAVAAGPLVWMNDDGRIRLPLEQGRGAGILTMRMERRGFVHLERLWLRWNGPLGLAWQQAEIPLDLGFPILPDLRLVQHHGAQLFERHSVHGLMPQMDRGEGSDFDAMVEYHPGMDRRSIDWKQSGRHAKLLAKHYRSERNNQIIFAVDSGRQMSEPVAGIPRVDRAVSAVLLTAWVALKIGDRVSIHAFDSRPRLASGLVSGRGAFGELQRIAADIDYSSEETNYTFALTTLATRLNRRSMIVLVTEFTDMVSADFLVRAVRRVVETHLLMVVVLRDEELEAIAGAKPERPEDVARAVTAFALLNDRKLVIGRLQHLGVHVIESEFDKVGERLVQGYIDLKRRNLL